MTTTRPSRPSPRILVVEDDADARENLSDLLELDGYDVVTAGRFDEVFARRDTATLFAIVLDRRLPDGTADQFLPRLKATAPSAAVIIVTGYRDIEGAIACLREGAEDYIMKPINVDALRRSLARIAERRRLEHEVAEISTREQQRIGRDLHDGLGQELTGIAMLGGVVRKKLMQRGAPEAEDMAEIVRLVNTAIQHTRALVRGLCPVNLEEDGLMVSLQDLANATEQLHAAECAFVCDEPVILGDYATATHLYYIAHEAVNNAIKHARAEHITIELFAEDGQGALVVRDDGTGVPHDVGDSRGRGLHIMRYRARLIGGQLHIDSRKDDGTSIVCRFPLTPPAP